MTKTATITTRVATTDAKQEVNGEEITVTEVGSYTIVRGDTTVWLRTAHVISVVVTDAGQRDAPGPRRPS